ncbi:hypothetical protein ONZ45_g14087 [Pleurotus djamor]|nr:hypothetical protein ONZ45_g14087 [Pleurotus djamor]
MNNLLRTLTESHLHTAHDANLRLLLTTVKDTRSYDAKVADAFYDSLEGLLQDLRTITIDNHDAEAFLKPVQKSEVPDYYDVISTPMDLQTMLKKVKQKAYKSKREFKDDLDLIWSNCRTYNATENHPLRQCAKRLQIKAERLLKHITDKKERTDPVIPSDLPRAKINGVNGHSKYRSPSYGPETPNSRLQSPHKRHPLRDVPFAEAPAIIRTPESMSLFSRLDKNIDSEDPAIQKPALEQVRELASCSRIGNELPDDEFSPMEVDDLGDKRKLNGHDRPRKRTRFTTPPLDSDDITHLWWKAAHCDELAGNGLPAIPFPSSSSLRRHKPTHSTLTGSPTPTTKRKRRWKNDTNPEPNPKSLLSLMNNNIQTLRRVRQTHAKFAALNINASSNEDADGTTADGPGFAVIPGIPNGMNMVDDDLTGVDADQIDERPWLDRIRGRRKVKKGGIEIGEGNATHCMNWTCSKVLEHAGFQASSQEALSVLSSLTSDYLSNVGRTIRFLSDKYGHTMSPEEIILHTLFESGTAQIQDLERYVSDDIERYGTRLGDLEKKLVGAYREVTAVEVPEDEGLFEEDEEEGGALVLGNFADAFGEDFFGLRELGIAAEYGLSSLTIPKRLFKGKKGDGKANLSSSKPNEPPPPFPPPPPFIPFDSTKVDIQIGLLKPYYQSRISSLSTTTLLPPPPPGPIPLGYPASAAPYGAPGFPEVMHSQPETQVVITLPDDPPNPAQTKMGPLGQIIKASPATGSSKKKGKSSTLAGAGPTPKAEGEPGSAIETLGSPSIPNDTLPTAPKKKKPNLGVGTGNGRKKKDGPPMGDNNGGGMNGGAGVAMPPPVIAASA